MKTARTQPVPTAILISGSGSNMQALIRAAEQENFPARIVLVISNCPDAHGLQKARAAGIEAVCIDHTSFQSNDRRLFERKLTHELEMRGVELVCLAGFMRILTDEFISRWKNRILNIHPSLLPLFKGLNTHRRALEAGVKQHGCSVHFVHEELDSGPVIAQAVVSVHSCDTPQTLAARVLKAEHQLYPRTLEHVARNSAQLTGDRAGFHEEALFLDFSAHSPD